MSSSLRSPYIKFVFKYHTDAKSQPKLRFIYSGTLFSLLALPFHLALFFILWLMFFSWVKYIDIHGLWPDWKLQRRTLKVNSIITGFNHPFFYVIPESIVLKIQRLCFSNCDIGSFEYILLLFLSNENISIYCMYMLTNCFFPFLY